MSWTSIDLNLSILVLDLISVGLHESSRMMANGYSLGLAV